MISAWDTAQIQSPPKVLEQQGQFLCFCNTLDTAGVETELIKNSEFNLLFPGIYT